MMFPEVVWTTAPIIAHVARVLLLFSVCATRVLRQITIQLEAFATYVTYPGSTVVAVNTQRMFLLLGYDAE